MTLKNIFKKLFELTQKYTNIYRLLIAMHTVQSHQKNLVGVLKILTSTLTIL